MFGSVRLGSLDWVRLGPVKDKTSYLSCRLNAESRFVVGFTVVCMHLRHPAVHQCVIFTMLEKWCMVCFFYYFYFFHV